MVTEKKMIKLGTWKEADCDICGVRYHATRTMPKEVPEDHVFECGECESYRLGAESVEEQNKADTNDLLRVRIIRKLVNADAKQLEAAASALGV